VTVARAPACRLHPGTRRPPGAPDQCPHGAGRRAVSPDHELFAGRQE